jgi:hypothetical protein
MGASMVQRAIRHRNHKELHMNPFSLFGLLPKIASSWSDFTKRESAYYSSSAELKKKYNLPDPVYGKSLGGATDATYDDVWLRTFDSLVDRLAGKSTVDAQCCELCGDIVMFCNVLDDNVWIDRWDNKGNYRPVFGRICEFRDTQAFLSVVEMSRGRGSDYALALINKELPGLLRPLA